MRTIEQPVRPMAIPFRIEHFRFQRQVELEEEIVAEPLFKKLTALYPSDQIQQNLLQRLEPGFKLPPGTMPVLDGAVHRVKTVTRLPYEFQVTTAFPGKNIRCLGLVRDKTIEIPLARDLLNDTDVSRVAYHLSIGLFYAFQPVVRHLLFLLMRDTPLAVAHRLKVIELLRLTDYAAACFGRVACGSATLVLEEEVRRGLDLRTAQFDHRACASAYLQSGELSAEHQLQVLNPWSEYHPSQVLVLDAFEQSEVFRACLGEPGGNSRLSFEAAVLELDSKMHPAIPTLPKDGSVAEFVGRRGGNRELFAAERREQRLGSRRSAPFNSMA